MKLVIQIPCFNEVQSLRTVVEALPKKLAGLSAVEVVIIDDASLDGTAELARQLDVDAIVQLRRHRGLAEAFRAGLDAALQRSADIIVNLDGDDQYLAEDIPRLIAPILAGDAEIVVGCRDVERALHFSAAKKFLQRLGSRVVRCASGTDVPDAASGFRAFSREAALRLIVLSNYTYTYDTLIHAGRHDLRVAWILVGCNPPVRPSRLFRSIPAHVTVSAYTILRSFLFYYPLRFFGVGAIMLLGLSALCFVAFMTARHVVLLVAGALFLCLSLNALFLAFLGALTTLNRRLLEELLYRFKRERALADDRNRTTVSAGQETHERPRSTKSQLFCLAILAIVTGIGSSGDASEAKRGSVAFVNAMDHGAACDGLADDAVALQNAINALPAAGGVVYIPPSPSGTRCTFSTALKLPDGAKIVGAGKWATVLRYTGSEAAFTPGGKDNRHAAFEDFTLQLTQPTAAGIDAARLISSTLRSIRIASSGPNVGGTGIRAVITDTTWTSYFNVVEDLIFDGLADGVLLDSSVAQAANRWRIIAPTVLAPQTRNTSNGIVLNRVQGVDIVGPYCDQIGGACIKLGASADRVTIVAGRLETSYGGAMFSIHPKANRTTILGYQVHAGLSGTNQLGTRAFLFGQWDEGIRWTESSSGSPVYGLRPLQENKGIPSNRITISGVSTTGRVTFNSPEPDTNYVPVVIQCGATGATAVGSNRLWVSNLETTGFNINAEVAPGAGNSITVCWYRGR